MRLSTLLCNAILVLSCASRTLAFPNMGRVQHGFKRQGDFGIDTFDFHDDNLKDVGLVDDNVKDHNMDGNNLGKSVLVDSEGRMGRDCSQGSRLDNTLGNSIFEGSDMTYPNPHNDYWRDAENNLKSNTLGSETVYNDNLGNVNFDGGKIEDPNAENLNVGNSDGGVKSAYRQDQENDNLEVNLENGIPGNSNLNSPSRGEPNLESMNSKNFNWKNTNLRNPILDSENLHDFDTSLDVNAQESPYLADSYLVNGNAGGANLDDALVQDLDATHPYIINPPLINDDFAALAYNPDCDTTQRSNTLTTCIPITYAPSPTSHPEPSMTTINCDTTTLNCVKSIYNVDSEMQPESYFPHPQQQQQQVGGGYSAELDDSDQRSNELRTLVQHLYVAQARVQLEATEIRKAQAVATSAQSHLEDAANRVRTITATLYNAQQEVAASAIRAQIAQLQLAAHDQLLFAARQDVDALSSQMVGLQAAEGIVQPKLTVDLHALLNKLRQPLQQFDRPTPVPAIVTLPPQYAMQLPQFEVNEPGSDTNNNNINSKQNVQNEQPGQPVPNWRERDLY